MLAVATLNPGGNQTFRAPEGTHCTVHIQNQNMAGGAMYAVGCSSIDYSQAGELKPGGSWTAMEDWKGGDLVVVNTTHPSAPSTIVVTFTSVGE